uniref:ATP-dependent Clp protease proteolytic subunit n=2 Tax=Lactuca sativa TaxID=4236 RepID=A0A9R1VB59_LACSA|nr:hypothetical protein LSAT_V11C600304800 [Lactuca sativa]KAJ0202169.1 hypothetical protein LSAT_V11C600304750 [Lactuca sativa]
MDTKQNYLKLSATSSRAHSFALISISASSSYYHSSSNLHEFIPTKPPKLNSSPSALQCRRIKCSIASSALTIGIGSLKLDFERKLKISASSPAMRGTETDAMGMLLRERIVFLGSSQSMISADVSTIALGISASTATIILGGGTKGKRFAMPNTRIMIHQPLGGASGQAIDENITRFIAESTGRSFEQVQKHIDRDRYLSPTESVEYGIIDGVIDEDSIIPLMPVPDRVNLPLVMMQLAKILTDS